ncbi:hypothetical protein [Bdellovibrio sp. BCCA]|uniref:hypothetical protein n=1 Tax=unclassified Bdellovibrio TaxID=2633795 RepID=UPI0030F24FE8
MLSFIVVLFLAGDAQAQEQAPPKKINTNLYEQEAEPEKTKSFSAKVKVVREESDGVEVFFEGENKGAYSLLRSTEHYAKMLKDLEDSRKPTGKPVKVVATTEKRIKTVEKSKSTEGSGDPNKPWDFGKIPD